MDIAIEAQSVGRPGERQIAATRSMHQN